MNLSSHIEWVRYSETLGHTNHISNSYTNCTAKKTKNKKTKNKKQTFTKPSGHGHNMLEMSIWISLAGLHNVFYYRDNKINKRSLDSFQNFSSLYLGKILKYQTKLNTNKIRHVLNKTWAHLMAWHGHWTGMT